MNIYNDEIMGFETLIPIEVINLLNSSNTKTDKKIWGIQATYTDALLLDEYELAMAA